MFRKIKEIWKLAIMFGEPVLKDMTANHIGKEAKTRQYQKLREFGDYYKCEYLSKLGRYYEYQLTGKVED